jgi:asparagine synthase (glutamine-hydrolysing)
VTWASRLEPLRLASAPSAAVDEEFIADFLSAFPGRSNTPFAGLEAVPPGEAVLFDRQGRRALVFWEPEQVEASAALSDADAEEGLRHHFSEAVRNRLRGGRPVCCELSGGLDSSSIVCVADDLLRRGTTDVPDLVTATFTFDRSPTSDESVFVNAVRHRVGRRHFALTESASPLFAGLDEAYLEYPAPKACFRALSDRMVAEMYVAGARVALSGFGGDEVLLSSGSSFAVELADLAREFRFGALPSRFRLWQRRLGGSLAVLLWQNLVHPLLPTPLRVRAPLFSFSLEPLLETEFVRRKHLSRRMLESSNEVSRDLSPSQRLRVAGIRRAVRSVSWQYDYGSHPVENRFPFLDRPLVEFCLGLPLGQHVRDGDGRSLHRRALASFLPPEVLSRRDKKGPDEALMRGLSQEWSRLAWLLESPRVCQRGWVRPDGFRRALDELRFGVRTTGASLVPKVLALEVWLRHLEQRAP